MARFSFFDLLLLGVLLCSQDVLARKSHNKRVHDDSHWVDIWASMPQLTELANLPPVPFVRRN